MVASQNPDEPELPGFAPQNKESQLKVSIRTIGPTEAQGLIDGSEYNRKVGRVTVRKYADEMAAGRWWENGQPIILNGKKLLNGAHRCHAIVQSGVALPFVVVEGVDIRANRTMDIGKPRTLDQMLELEGKHAPEVLAQALGWLIGYAKGPRLGAARGAGKSFTVLDKFDLFFEHPDLEKVCLGYTRRVPGSKILDKGMYACLHYLFRQKSADDVEVFMKQVMEGENLQKGDPSYTYREGVIHLSTEDDAKATRTIKAKCAQTLIYAWNKFRAKEQWAKFKLIDNCPEIV